MTENEREQMVERKRAGYARRLRLIREKHELPALSNRTRESLLNLVMGVQGDGLTDPDLLVLHRLASRGLCDYLYNHVLGD